jgi:hypothetical protein
MCLWNSIYPFHTGGNNYDQTKFLGTALNMQHPHMSVLIYKKKVNILILKPQNFSATVLHMHVKFPTERLENSDL